MHYDIAFKPRAIKDLKALTPRERDRNVAKVEGLQDGLTGDVKRLTNFTPEFRLRVGDYRVLFDVEGGSLVIYRVMHRGEAYR
ncbi:MAG: type II toxin-antitoxin system RelE/ParE family toxin [Nitrospira sp.]|nr:MAG: type II toxin-antitoxin system RelE/ParE family toxin [Nitrospira sp.]